MPETFAARGSTTDRLEVSMRAVDPLEPVDGAAATDAETAGDDAPSAEATVAGTNPTTRAAARTRAIRRMGEVSGQIGRPFGFLRNYRTPGGPVTSSHPCL